MQALVYVKTERLGAFAVIDNRVDYRFCKAKPNVLGDEEYTSPMDESVRPETPIPRDSWQWEKAILPPREEITLQWVVAQSVTGDEEEQDGNHRFAVINCICRVMAKAICSFC